MECFSKQQTLGGNQRAGELSVRLNLEDFPHSLLTKEIDRLRKNPLCFPQLEIYLSSTLHLLIFMLFHILPIPLPEIKLGLLLEALLVL